ncbi:OmpA/MotB family protein [Pengzhenrongella sicca]|uniref:Flagellar motor protein MotB n=1 Tax=Pengzhenrongella sicca TaxID=2819238 RepID=A0A8A4ZFV5_9MICO|nr:flagellar motor protein MotB [Pengzhenrongella sicca]QTE29879.1 flagellar motor protein MotB [Pengzhenrongella sicca]
MSAQKGRKPRVHEEEHENHERWAVSYADMMTVLVGLFIVLYAMSQVDQTKFEALRGSLAAGFGNASPTVLTGAAGLMDSAGTVPDTGLPSGPETNQIAPAAAVDPAVDPADVPATDAGADGEVQAVAQARDELTRLLAMQAQIEANLAAVGMAGQVRYVIDARGLVIGLVANDFYFDEGSAALKPAATTVIDAAGPVLAAITDQISIEGHTNATPISGRYATNWELSSDRATQVLRRLVENNAVPGDRIAAVGYGSSRPLVDSGADALTANRRVDLVIHSPLPEPVRELLPSMVTGTGK